MTKRLFRLLVLVLALVAVWLAFSNRQNAQLANPASVYCVEQGGRLEIRTDGQGNQYGVCHLPDGRECEEWAFFQDGQCVAP